MRKVWRPADVEPEALRQAIAEINELDRLFGLPTGDLVAADDSPLVAPLVAALHGTTRPPAPAVRTPSGVSSDAVAAGIEHSRHWQRGRDPHPAWTPERQAAWVERRRATPYLQPKATPAPRASAPCPTVAYVAGWVIGAALVAVAAIWFLVSYARAMDPDRWEPSPIPGSAQCVEAPTFTVANGHSYFTGPVYCEGGTTGTVP